jgi:tetratricopeptide (TPR) repeat protein
MTIQSSIIRWSIVTATLIMLGLAVPASATFLDDIADCNQGADSDLRVDGCSGLIESGRLAGNNLAIAHVNRGNAYNAIREIDHAIADYDKAIEIKPDYAPAYYNRGIAHFEQGDLVLAIADYDKAIEIDRDDPDTYDSRGFAYADLRDYERAIADFDQAIALDPDFAAAYYHRSLAYGAKGDLELGLVDFDRAIELGCLRQGWCPPR